DLDRRDRPGRDREHAPTDRGPPGATARGATGWSRRGERLRRRRGRPRRAAIRGGAAEPNACGGVAVVAGGGNRAIFASLGAAVIVEGGQSMNPSAAGPVEATEAAPPP